MQKSLEKYYNKHLRYKIAPLTPYFRFIPIILRMCTLATAPQEGQRVVTTLGLQERISTLPLEHAFAAQSIARWTSG
jgi:hypothetical protein